MNVLIVNHSVKNCGVYQYGKRVAGILKESNVNNYIYLESDNSETLQKSIESHKPKVIIYNYLSGTMPWVTEDTVQEIRNLGILQTLLVHNINFGNFFDAYFHQDPNYLHKDERNFSLARPLFDYEPIRRDNSLDTIFIGSFGFGFKVKHFDQICRIVSKEFKKQKIQVNLHVTESFFSPNKHVIDSIESKCKRILWRKKHKLVVTRDFMSDEDVLNFLAYNDLNIFLYEKYKNYNGISSTIDYALSAETPIAVNDSNMFSHITSQTSSILIEENSLQSIIDDGFESLRPLKDRWSHSEFLRIVDDALDGLTK